jgi:class 3 adenylate cyclase
VPENIFTSRRALEGERKQVTVLFADVKGAMALLADRDQEEAQHLLDPVLERMMDAMHRYEGTMNQVMGDGILALFGAMGDTWSNIAHLLEQHGKRTQTITGHDRCNRQGAPLCLQRAPGGRLWECASRVSVGFGPTRPGTPECASGGDQRRNIH